MLVLHAVGPFGLRRTHTERCRTRLLLHILHLCLLPSQHSCPRSSKAGDVVMREVVRRVIGLRLTDTDDSEDS